MTADVRETAPDRTDREMNPATVTNGTPGQRLRGLALLMHCIFALFLLCFACAFVCAGVQAVRTGECSYRWRETVGITAGPVGMARHQQGTTTLTGSGAVRRGIGLIAGGMLFLCAGCGLVAGLLRGKEKQRPYIPYFTLLAAPCFPVIGICFFPPWQIADSPDVAGFYAVLALAAGAAVLSYRQIWQRYVPCLLPAIILATLLLDGIWHLGVLAGVGTGIFFALGIAVVGLLYRDARALRSNGEPSP